MADYPLCGSLGYGLWAIRTGKFGSIVHIIITRSVNLS